MPEKNGFQIRKTEFPIQKFICVETYLGQGEFQPKRLNITLKTGFIRISGKTGSQIQNFFGLKPFRDQDEASKKKFSQIGLAVLEEIGRKQTNTHTNIVLLYKRDII